MKNFNVKQSGSEVILEEVNPHPKTVLNNYGYVVPSPEWLLFTPLILTSIDPNIKEGDLIREDQLEPDLWQYKGLSGTWLVCMAKDLESIIKLRMQVRQVAKLKQPVHETPSTEMCEDCKGHGWRMNPNSVDDSGICPSCNGTGGVHETQESVHVNGTWTKKEGSDHDLETNDMIEELKQQARNAPFESKEYWKLKCTYLQKSYDPTYSKLERTNCRILFQILEKRYR